MPSNRTATRRTWALIAMLAALMLVVGVLPAAAQDAQPTFTAADPLTRAFAAVRQALGVRFNVDLSVVRQWEWEQTEFTNGIDDCTIFYEQERPLYFGWRFVITSMDGRQFEGRSSFDATIITTCDSVTSGSTAPAANATANPNLPAPVAGSAATGSFELGGQALELNQGTADLLRRSRMTWVKQQYRYTLGADPSAVANLITNAHAQGFKILLSIPGDHTQITDIASYSGTFAQFLGGVAALGADAIEVWNEPNIDREWPVGQISGANYTQMLAAAFNAIKSRNPNTIVISAAPAPTGFFGGCSPNGCDDDAFMQQMAAAGAASYMDCVGLHYNEGIVSPTSSGGDSRGSYPTYFFGSMLQRGYAPFGGKPVCWTELGFLSPQGFNAALPGAFGWAQNTTVAQQAQWIAEAAVASAQSGRVRLMIVWNMDFSSFGADPAGGYALRRPDGTCPGCDSLAAVMQ